MNRKAQQGPLAFIFLLILFVMAWALFFGEIIADWGQRAIATNGLTGIEAFLVGNLNLWIGLGMLGGIGLAIYLGGSRG